MSREEMNIVVVGHVDHGKSTLIGRLLYDTNSLSDGAIKKVKEIAKETGKNFEYAYLLDAFEEEQKQGITIDTTRINFKGDKRDYVIIDAPGHKEFLKNMISGAAGAEAALLLVDGKEGVKEQTKRHGYILSLIGIKKVIVVINKMDLIDYKKEVFEKVKVEYEKFLKDINIEPMSFIPISAFNGDNLVEKSKKMNWYKGKTVLEAIDDIKKEKDDYNGPLRIPIQDVYKFDNRRIIAGRIENGRLSVGDEIIITPSNKVTQVKSIESWPIKEKVSATKGESIGITFENEYFFKRGEVISKLGEEPIQSNQFNGSIFWMGNEKLELNKEYKLKIGTTEIGCKISKINKRINSSTLEMEQGDYILKNEVGEVVINTDETISFDEFNNISETGRFVLVDNYDISGGGIINNYNKSKDFNILEKIILKLGFSLK